MRRILTLVFISAFFNGGVLWAQDYLSEMSLPVLQAETTNLNGAGIHAAQIEAPPETGGTNWEVNPSYVGRSLGFLTYVSPSGFTTNFPNSVSSESGHADGVGNVFYGITAGVATNLAHVDNWGAVNFVQGEVIGNNYIITLPATNIDDPVVNQSFVFTDVNTNEQVAIDKAYDNYAAEYKTLFVSGAGDGGPVSPPATAYNCLSCGSYGSGSSYGPTPDNGRCKPDLTAPQDSTSHSTPEIAGAAALLIQAGLRGDGGSDTNSAVDIRTLKALLMNGAVKPAGWTNIAPSPLDFNYGAGIVNFYNSYVLLAGGKRGYDFSTNVPQGTVHPPPAVTSSVSVLNGWNFTNLTSGATSDAVNHYFFNVTNGSSAPFMQAATLVWNRQQNQSGINNLRLFLYNCANSNLVACSTSAVDNVQHIFTPHLPPGRYDLQVWKAAGTPGVTIVSSSETYALAFAFVAPLLKQVKSGTNIALTWPVYPAGFSLLAETNLTANAWSANNLPAATITNGQNLVTIGLTNAVQFFRLQCPAF